jgi:hypothetical protein
MTRRLLALMMAIVVAGAPEALEVCQVICATAVTAGGSTTAASDIAAHHSHHREAAPSRQLELRAVPDACGPGKALLPSAARKSARAPVQPAIAATVQAFPIVSQSTRTHAPGLRQKPPGLPFLAASLRI